MNTMKRSMISTCTGLGLAAALTITSAMSAGATQLTDEDPAHSLSATTQVSEDEALVDVSPSDVDTQAVPVIAIIIAMIAMGGSAHAMGTEAARKAYYAGLRNAEYQSIKWTVRATVVTALGPALGGTFMVGFENQFYAMS